MKYLITGGCGFVGSNIAAEVLAQGHELIIADNMYRIGTQENIKWLENNGHFKHYHCDVSNTSEVFSIIKDTQPEVIFHLAGQVAMTSSIKSPRRDFEINALGTFNVLEAVRNINPKIKIIFASTNKVYGDLEYLNYCETTSRYEAVDYVNGFDTDLPLSFQSPYGCSKGTGDQYTLDYAKTFDLNTVVFRHSTVYGEHQLGTFDQGWIAWFCQQAIAKAENYETDEFTISGNGKQVRDILHVKDVAKLYTLSIERFSSIKGRAFNVGGSVSNSLSLLELFELLDDCLKIKLKFKKLPPRASDQKYFACNLDKITELTGWRPTIDKKTGIENMIKWMRN